MAAHPVPGGAAWPRLRVAPWADTEHHSYGAEAVHLFWEQLVQADRVFQLWRAGSAGSLPARR